MSRPPKRLPLFLGTVTVLFATPLAAWAHLGTLSRYMADDFCYSAVALDLGLLGAQRYWFTLWSGRFAFTLAVSAAAQLGTVTAPLFPGLTLLVWLSALAAGMRRLPVLAEARHRRLAGLCLAAVVLFATLANTPNVAQSLFWRNSLLTYTAPLVLGSIHFAFLAVALRRPRGGLAPWMAGSLGLAFLAGGFSEVYAVLQFAALCAAAGLACLFYLRTGRPALARQAFWLLLAGAIGAGLALAVVTLAPGTRARQATFAEPPGLRYLLSNAALYARWFLGDTARRAPVAWLLAALVPGLLAFGLGHQAAAPWKLHGSWLAAGLAGLPLLTFALLVACYAPAFYALLYLPPERVVIIPSFLLMALSAVWGYLAGLAVLRLVPRSVIPARDYLAPAAFALATFGSLLPVSTASQVLAGRAAARSFAATWDSYDRLLHTAGRTGVPAVTLAQLENLGAVDGYSSDPTHWVNRCAASYYGVQIEAVPPPPLPPDSALDALTPLDAEIGGVARVLGYHVASAAVRPGDELAVTIYWLPLAHTGRPYTAFLHLYHPDFGSLAQVDQYPGGERYPTTLWILERPVSETITLQVPATAPDVEDAWLVLGLYDLETLQRLPVTGADAGPPAQSWAEFGPISIRR